MPVRKTAIAVGRIYHICNKSIAEYRIFNTKNDYERMIDLILFHSLNKIPVKYSSLKKLYGDKLRHYVRVNYKVKIICLLAYCIMPTHVHFIIREIKEGGTIEFMSQTLQGYTQYFNALHNRKGPLWEGRFTNVLIEAEEQMRHTIRYVHLNPSTAYLVNNPLEWQFSSYKEYLALIPKRDCLCDQIEYAGIEPLKYRQFVEEEIENQRISAQNKPRT